MEKQQSETYTIDYLTNQIHKMQEALKPYSLYGKDYKEEMKDTKTNRKK